MDVSLQIGGQQQISVYMIGQGIRFHGIRIRYADRKPSGEGLLSPFQRNIRPHLLAGSVGGFVGADGETGSTAGFADIDQPFGAGTTGRVCQQQVKDTFR